MVAIVLVGVMAVTAARQMAVTAVSPLAAAAARPMAVTAIKAVEGEMLMVEMAV